MNEPICDPPIANAPTPEAVTMLNYATPVKRPHRLALGGIVLVAAFDLAIGFSLMLIGGVAMVDHPGMFPSELLVFGLVLFVLGLWMSKREKWHWQRAFDLIVVVSVICTALTAMAVLRVRNERNGINDGLMYVLLTGGTLGSVNLAAGYLLCRAKSSYGLGNLDTRWRERACLLFPIPLLLLVTGFVIAIYHA